MFGFFLPFLVYVRRTRRRGAQETEKEEKKNAPIYRMQIHFSWKKEFFFGSFLYVFVARPSS